MKDKELLDKIKRVPHTKQTTFRTTIGAVSAPKQAPKKTEDKVNGTG